MLGADSKKVSIVGIGTSLGGTYVARYSARSQSAVADPNPRIRRRGSGAGLGGDGWRHSKLSTGSGVFGRFSSV